MSNRLPVLQAAVRDAHESVGRHLAAAAEQALSAGAALIEAKSLLKHGTWLPWLAEAGLSSRSASRYMALARSGMNSAIVADLGFNSAEAFATAGERMVPSAGVAVEIHHWSDDDDIQIIETWWSVGERLDFRKLIIIPQHDPDDRVLLVRPRAPVPLWVAGALRREDHRSFDHCDRREMPIEVMVAWWNSLDAMSEAAR